MPSTSDWEPPSPGELQVMLPQYEISGLLGRGGMGAVYRGRQAKLDRDVAIKVLPETFTKGEDELNFAKRFEQEARAMAKLDHPAIITVFDFGETPQGQLYFVMEFVDGMDISQYLRLHDGVLPQEHALAIVAHVLDALAYAHANGIVHRDIKPANILLNQQGRVKIADFGLAKRFGDHAGDDGSALTMSNVAVGTPVFVAPEALEGSGPVDQRADLYAVGVMLYQLLTGKLPRGNFSPASHLNSAIDPRLDSVLAKAMESDPSRRYSSAEDLRADLDAILSGPVPALESGDDTRVAPAAVPVDTILRGRKPRAPVRKAKSGNSSAWIAVGVGALVLVGAVYLISTRARAPETLPVAAKERLLEANPGTAMVARDSGTTDDPAKATKERPFVNSLGMKFVPVPGTEVLFCVHETRYRDYEEYAEKANANVEGSWKNRTNDGFEAKGGENDHPVNRVSWDDARKFCSWLSEKEGNNYRLPTDHEWSHAVGIGREADLKADAATVTSSKIPERFPWGKEWPPPTGVGNYSDETRRAKAPRDDGKYLYGYDDGFPTTAPVMSFEENQFGLFDLGGNVWEWCEDSYSSEQSECVLRGASWRDSDSGTLLSAVRNRGVPGRRDGSNGFRVVLDFKKPKPSRTSVSPNAAPTTNDPAKATKERPFVNSLGMKFVPVPGTKVLCCIHETRWKDYAAYAAETPGVDSAWEDQGIDRFTVTDRPEDHPVWRVGWNDAKAFCLWLGRKEGRTYRLPTDEEWSVAAGLAGKEIRSATDTPETLNGRIKDVYPWEGTWPPGSDVGNFSDSSRRSKAPGAKSLGYLDDLDDGFPTTAPVMSFRPNAFGIHDLAGNLNEWVEDRYSPIGENRVVRGGAFNVSDRNELLASSRKSRGADARLTEHGFRVVVEHTTPTADSIPPQSLVPGAVEKGAQEPWIDGLAAWWNGAKDNECFTSQPDGTTRQICDFATLAPIPAETPAARDQIARIKARLEGGGGDGSDLFRVYVRRSKDAEGMFSTYTAGLNRNGKQVRLGFYQGSTYTGLENFPLPENFNFSLHHTLELSAIGDELTVSLDGTELGKRKHSGIREGHPALTAKKGTIIASFEYQIPKSSGPSSVSGPQVETTLAKNAPEMSDFPPLRSNPNPPKILAGWALQNGFDLLIRHKGGMVTVTNQAEARDTYHMRRAAPPALKGNR